MVRGTTPTMEFTLPFETSLIDEIYITFAQDDRIIIDKSYSDCTLSGSKVSITLTQDDTLLFMPGRKVEIQIRVKTTDGNVSASKIMTTTVDRILREGVI